MRRGCFGTGSGRFLGIETFPANGPAAIPLAPDEPVWLHVRNVMHAATFVRPESARNGTVRVRLAGGEERIVSSVYVTRREGGAA